LNYNSSDESIRNALGEDEVTNVRIATDRETGKARGFGYVQFASAEIAQRVFERGKLNIDGRDVNIDYAEDRPSGGGGAEEEEEAAEEASEEEVAAEVIFCLVFVLRMSLTTRAGGEGRGWRRTRLWRRRNAAEAADLAAAGAAAAAAEAGGATFGAQPKRTTFDD